MKQRGRITEEEFEALKRTVLQGLPKKPWRRAGTATAAAKKLASPGSESVKGAADQGR
jgi:hypothetical protein